MPEDLGDGHEWRDPQCLSQAGNGPEPLVLFSQEADRQAARTKLLLGKIDQLGVQGVGSDRRRGYHGWHDSPQKGKRPGDQKWGATVNKKALFWPHIIDRPASKKVASKMKKNRQLFRDPADPS
jgi:hypothetical protein